MSIYTFKPSVTSTIWNWYLLPSQIILVSTLVIVGCTSEHSGGQDKQIGQGKDDASSKAVHKEVGEASWYGPGFNGKETANGETFNQAAMTAAHPTLTMDTKAKVTNIENGKQVEVRINDRGPYAGNRAIDLSSAAANKLDMKAGGTTQVKIETKPTKKKGVTKPPVRKNKAKKRRH